jgi:hypothetical protein
MGAIAQQTWIQRHPHKFDAIVGGGAAAGAIVVPGMFGKAPLIPKIAGLAIAGGIAGGIGAAAGVGAGAGARELRDLGLNKGVTAGIFGVGAVAALAGVGRLMTFTKSPDSGDIAAMAMIGLITVPPIIGIAAGGIAGALTEK